MVDQNREEFEEWFREFYKAKIGHPDYSLETHMEYPHQYVMDIPHHDYLVWKHSRTSLAVVLPSTDGVDVRTLVGSVYKFTVDTIRELLQQKGVTIK